MVSGVPLCLHIERQWNSQGFDKTRAVATRIMMHWAIQWSSFLGYLKQMSPLVTFPTEMSPIRLTVLLCGKKRVHSLYAVCIRVNTLCTYIYACIVTASFNRFSILLSSWRNIDGPIFFEKAKIIIKIVDKKY